MQFSDEIYLGCFINTKDKEKCIYDLVFDRRERERERESQRVSVCVCAYDGHVRHIDLELYDLQYHK